MRRLALEEYLEIQRAIEAVILAEFAVERQRSELHGAVAAKLEPFILVHKKDFPERIGHKAVSAMRLTERAGHGGELTKTAGEGESGKET